MHLTKDEVLKELERLQHDFEEKKVEVKCLESRGEFDIGGKRIKLQKGSVLQIPFWIAYMLHKEGLVEYDFLKKFNLSSVHFLTEKEKTKKALQPIDPFFYIIAKKTIEEFKEQKTISFRELERLEIELRELMTLRLNKVINMSTKSKNITSTIRNLTVEEKWLYNIVADAVEKWKIMVG